jgi:hypothetical protein
VTSSQLKKWLTRQGCQFFGMKKDLGLKGE